MFWKTLKLLAWASFLSSVAAGSYLFFIGQDDSYHCRAMRWIKDTAPIAPIPVGYCGAVDPSDPRNLPQPNRPLTPDLSIYFKRKSAYGEYPYKQTILIKSGCVFDPPAPQMKSNTTVTWLNQDSRPHAIVSDKPDGSSEAFAAFQSPPIPSQGKYVMFVNQPGSFSYRCADEPAVKGTFSVIEW